MNSIAGLVVIPIIIIIFVLLVALEIFLSLQKNKWYGLILPIVYLLMAAFAAFGLLVYSGEIASLLIPFFLLSIPAVINFVVYLACRASVKAKNKKEIVKMSIQDLH